MPLSNDPEKRRRQLENLSRGGQVAAERHNFPAGHGAQGDPATAGSSDLGHETAGGEDPARGALPVVGYGRLEEPTPPPPAVEPRAAAGDPDVSQNEPFAEPANEPEQETHEDEEPRERGGLGGLLDGFVGR